MTLKWQPLTFVSFLEKIMTRLPQVIKLFPEAKFHLCSVYLTRLHIKLRKPEKNSVLYSIDNESSKTKLRDAKYEKNCQIPREAQYH
jgi:hypothetical protein